MPSKTKKGRGKARKAVRKADEQQRSMDTQMERLKIDKDEDSRTNADEDALLEEAIKLAAAEKDQLDAASAEKEEWQLEVCRLDTSKQLKKRKITSYCWLRPFCLIFILLAAIQTLGGALE
jgi:hypothetical protein